MKIKFIFKKIYIIFLSGLVLYGLSLVVINQWQLRFHPNKKVLDAAKTYENDMAYLANRFEDEEWRFQSFRGMSNQGFSFRNTFNFNRCFSEHEIKQIFLEVGLHNIYQNEYKKNNMYIINLHTLGDRCETISFIGTSNIKQK